MGKDSKWEKAKAKVRQEAEDDRGRRRNPFIPLEQGLRRRIVAWEKAVEAGDKKKERVTRGAVRGYAIAFYTIIHPEAQEDVEGVSILEQQYGMPGPRQNERIEAWQPVNSNGGSMSRTRRKRSPRRR